MRPSLSEGGCVRKVVCVEEGSKKKDKEGKTAKIRIFTELDKLGLSDQRERERENVQI